jgi:hypothetical protein
VSAAKAELVFDRMCVAGITPDTVTWETLVNAWANCGDVESAAKSVAIVERMASARGDVTIYTWNIVLKGFAKCRDAMSAAHAEMILNKILDAGVVTNTITWNTVINAWANSTDPQRGVKANGLLSRMLTTNIKPDLYTWSIMTRAFSRDVDALFGLLADFKKFQGRADAHTAVRPFLVAIGNERMPGRWDERTAQLLAFMREHDIPMSTVTRDAMTYAGITVEMLKAHGVRQEAVPGRNMQAAKPRRHQSSPTKA